MRKVQSSPNFVEVYYSKKMQVKRRIMTIIIIIIINNGNRTEWSPIRSVIIRGRPICLITSMITDRIERHEVLLPINHNFKKMGNIIGYFLNQNTSRSRLHKKFDILFC